MARRTRAEMRQRVLEWEAAVGADSAMYSTIALAAAAHDDLLDVLRAVPAGQIEMNMLLAAVQYLLLEAPDEQLAAWYPSVGGNRAADDGLAEAFTEFVLTHRSVVTELMTTRRVQTNEVARCVFLLPAYNVVASIAEHPIALLEVGTSAGLNQNVDRYGYTYRSESGSWSLGPDSTLQLHTSIDRPRLDAAERLPEIVWRAGLDLHPIDVTDADQARWLQALVWADQVERHARLVAAIGVANDHPPRLVAGDAFATVGRLAAEAPEEAALVVQHSFVMNQFARADRERFYALLDQLATARPIYRVAAEWLVKSRRTRLDVTVHGAERENIELAQVHHHGAWIRWRHD